MEFVYHTILAQIGEIGLTEKGRKGGAKEGATLKKSDDAKSPVNAINSYGMVALFENLYGNKWDLI